MNNDAKIILKNILIIIKKDDIEEAEVVKERFDK